MIFRVIMRDAMFESDIIVSKRALGMLMIAGGVLVAAAASLADVTGTGLRAGLGPFQQVMLGISALSIILGLPLLWLGNRPA
jgi:hypothetical protein